MAKEFAPGIKRKDYPGDISKIRKGQLLDLIIQEHAAKRRGLHWDLRLGDPKMGLFSWAMMQKLPQHEGQKINTARTNLHSYKYKDFEGLIPKGVYGHGTVKKDSENKALVTRVTPQTISFSVADKKHPERYVLINPGEKYGDKLWMLLRQKTPAHTGITKEHYKTLKENKVEEYLKNLPKGSVVQPKIDGALQLVTIGDNKVEMLSHRISDTTNKPVLHTERFFRGRPHLKIPKELRNSVLLAEVYASKNGKPMLQQETSGILNSSLAKALSDQDEKGINLRAMVFNIVKLKGKKVDESMPYEERKKLMEKLIKVLPEDKFHLPEEASNSKGALSLWNKIKSRKHNDSLEGVVIHPNTGLPTKVKVLPEQDVHIRGFFPGEGKYKNNAVGGFLYSHTKDGKIVGKVGTGLSDNVRKLMHEHPEWFVNRIARVHSHGQQPSGALRVPAFINLHEG